VLAYTPVQFKVAMGIEPNRRTERTELELDS